MIGVFIGVWSGVGRWDKGSGSGVLAAVLQGLSLAALAGCRCFGTLLFEGKVALDVKGPWDPASDRHYWWSILPQTMQHV